MVREALGQPDTGTELETLVTFVHPYTQSNTQWQFVIRDEVARALEAPGWV